MSNHHRHERSHRQTPQGTPPGQGARAWLLTSASSATSTFSPRRPAFLFAATDEGSCQGMEILEAARLLFHSTWTATTSCWSPEHHPAPARTRRTSLTRTTTSEAVSRGGRSWRRWLPRRRSAACRTAGRRWLPRGRPRRAKIRAHPSAKQIATLEQKATLERKATA